MEKKNISVDALMETSKYYREHCIGNLTMLKGLVDEVYKYVVDSKEPISEASGKIARIFFYAQCLVDESDSLRLVSKILSNQKTIDRHTEAYETDQVECKKLIARQRTNIVDEVKKYAKMKTYCGCIGMQYDAYENQRLITDLVNALKFFKRINQYAFKYRDFVIKPQEMFLVKGKVGRTPIKSIKELFDIIAKKDKKTMIVIKGEIDVPKQK